MKKRLLGATLACVLALCACSPSTSASNGNFEGESSSSAPTTSFSESTIQTSVFDGHIGINTYPIYNAFGVYDLLDEHEQELWRVFLDIFASKEVGKVYSIPKTTRAEIDAFYILFVHQFPPGLALDLAYKPSDTFYEDGTFSGVYLSKLSYDNTSRVDELYEKAKEILSSLECDGTDESKAFAIAKWLSDNVTYDASKQVIATGDIAILYDTLMQGRAVCAGYAEAYTYLCTIAGLKVINIRGIDDAASFDHEWNMINLDGSWYHVDTTWMTPDNYYRYFLLTDSEILVDHYNPELYTDVNGKNYLPKTPLSN